MSSLVEDAENLDGGPQDVRLSTQQEYIFKEALAAL